MELQRIASRLIQYTTISSNFSQLLENIKIIIKNLIINNVMMGFIKVLITGGNGSSLMMCRNETQSFQQISACKGQAASDK